jgi:hypothetical protein
MITSAMRFVSKVATRMRMLTPDRVTFRGRKALIDTKADFDTISAKVLSRAANEAGISTTQLTHFINLLAKEIEG